MSNYSRLEMMAIAGSRLISNQEVVLVGTGLPLVSTLLAKQHHAPDIIVLMESGLYDSNPQALPFCVADPRGVYQTPWIGSAIELMGQFLQNKKVDLGFLGGAQVDRYGNRAQPIPPPNEHELNLLRTKVDPEGIFMKY